MVERDADVWRHATGGGFGFDWDSAVSDCELAGTNVPNASLREVVQELRGKFVASYALTGKVAFRCFEYDPKSGRYSLDWGLMLMLLPAAFAMLVVFWAFFLIPKQPETTGAP